MKVKRINNNNKKKKENVLNGYELALKHPAVYEKEMQKSRKTEGVAIEKHNDSVIKIFYHVDMLLSLMDDVLDSGVLVQNIKAKAKLFLRELESYNSNMYAVSNKGVEQVNELITEQEQLHNLINNTHNLYYTDLFDVLTEYNKTKSKEQVINLILENKYALFKDYELPDIVRKQVLRIEPEADKFTIIHLSELVTREKVENLRGLNHKTLEVLDKMFRNAQVKW